MKKIILLLVVLSLSTGCIPLIIKKQRQRRDPVYQQHAIRQRELDVKCGKGFYNRLNCLELGMSKEEVKELLGKPTPRGMMKNEETWEYKKMGMNSYDIYWIKFVDGKLVFWGKPGDYGTTMPEHREEITVKYR